MTRRSLHHALAALALVGYLLVEQFTTLFSTYPALEVVGAVLLLLAPASLGHLAWTWFRAAG